MVYKVHNCAIVTDVGLKVHLVHQVLLVFFVSGLEYYALQKNISHQVFSYGTSLIYSFCRILISNKHQIFSKKVWRNTLTLTTRHSKKSIDFKGKKTVTIQKSTSDTKRATLAVSVKASGKMLAPYMIFKGAPNGCIKQQEFPIFSKDGITCVRKMGGWMRCVCWIGWRKCWLLI